MKDLELISKDSNKFYHLDFNIKDGNISTVEDDDLINQAIKKSIISPIYPSGYGIDIKYLLGYKYINVDPLLRLRVIQNLAVLSKIYNIDFNPLEVTTSFEQDGVLRLTIKTETLTSEITI